MTRKQFEVLVEKALRTLPAPFKDKVANIAVVVEDWADDEAVGGMGIEPPDTLFGFDRGVDITQRDSTYGNVLPDVITIYQGPIEEDAADEAEMAEIVRETVVHELGHYFGLDDDTMHRIEDGEAGAGASSPCAARGRWSPAPVRGSARASRGCWGPPGPRSSSITPATRPGPRGGRPTCKPPGPMRGPSGPPSLARPTSRRCSPRCSARGAAWTS